MWTGRTRTKEAMWISDREHWTSFRKNSRTQNILTPDNVSSNCKHPLVFIYKIITRTASVATRIVTRPQQMRRNERTRSPQWFLVIKKVENVTHVLRRLFFETHVTVAQNIEWWNHRRLVVTHMMSARANFSKQMLCSAKRWCGSLLVIVK